MTVCGGSIAEKRSELAQNMEMQIFGSLLSRSRQSVSKHLNRTMKQNSLSALVDRQ